MVDIRENMMLLLDGGYEVWGNFIVNDIQSNQGVILQSQFFKEKKKFGRVSAIFFQEWGIRSGVLRHNLMTSDDWFKMWFKMLANRVGGVNISG